MTYSDWRMIVSEKNARIAELEAALEGVTARWQDCYDSRKAVIADTEARAATSAILRKAAEALHLEWIGLERFVSEITGTDPTNPDGAKLLAAYRVSAGAWLLLQARIRHVIGALSEVAPEEVSALIQTYRADLAEQARLTCRR